jgi:hypothetical protein
MLRGVSECQRVLVEDVVGLRVGSGKSRGRRPIE